MSRINAQRQSGPRARSSSGSWSLAAPTLRSMALLFVLAFAAGGCSWSLKFTDASFPEALNTVTIEDFDNGASFVAPGLTQRLAEALRDKFTRETNVIVTDQPGSDWTFQGTVTRYEITPIAPTGNETTALNRLTIAVKVDFESLLDPDANWSQQFSRFADYDAADQLSSVEDGLIEDINAQLVQDMFNKVASNW
jgi:hypothetical protein